MDLSTLIKKLSKLKVDRSKGTPAPHKAILLLSILQSIDEGEITENKVFITPEIVARFKNNWHTLVRDERFTPNFTLPFFHLRSSGFWFLTTYLGKEIVLTSSASISSFSSLKNTIAYASFDSEVFTLLANQRNREFVKQTLLSIYLNGQSLNDKKYDFLHKVENQILNETSTAYKNEVAAADEEEIFVRGGVFKKVIPRVYNYTCCISGMKIIATRDIQMIDACHIVPFSESHDDTIKNGISLSPNFHRAFDRFLITINEHFEVIVSENFTESGIHSIRAFHGKKIILPNESRYQPSIKNIKWHAERFMQLHK